MLRRAPSFSPQPQTETVIARDCSGTRRNIMRESKLLLTATLIVAGLSACMSGCGGAQAVDPKLPTTSALSVAISPKDVSNLPAGATQTFTAIVTGSSNQAVTWSVQEGVACGSVTSGGTYSA